jgi:hypothetical protein
MIGAPAEMVTPREFRRNLDLLPRPKLSGKTPPKLSGKKVAACVGLSPLGPGIVAVHPSSMPRCSRSQAAPGSVSATARVPRRLRIQPESRNKPAQRLPEGASDVRPTFCPIRTREDERSRLPQLIDLDADPRHQPFPDLRDGEYAVLREDGSSLHQCIGDRYPGLGRGCAPHAGSFDSSSRIRLRRAEAHPTGRLVSAHQI